MKYQKRNRPYENVKENLLVLTNDGKSIITLNNTAFAIWQNCEGRELEEVVQCVLHMYKLDVAEFYDTVKNDCIEILEYLGENGLIKEG